MAEVGLQSLVVLSIPDVVTQLLGRQEVVEGLHDQGLKVRETLAVNVLGESEKIQSRS